MKAVEVLDLLAEHNRDEFYGDCVECTHVARSKAFGQWPGPHVKWPCDVIKQIAERAAEATDDPQT